jgi:hypothetical protein
MMELTGGETVILTAWALLLLVAGRVLWNKPGSSSAMAGIAVLFKSVNAAPFLCHLVGIALLGVAFDLMATLLLRGERKPVLRALFAGVSSAYLSCLLFATTMVWIVEYEYWAGGGIARVWEHTLYPGSRGALAALIAVPLGLWLGRALAQRAEGQPRAVLGTAAVASAVLWVLGAFVG